ncbi:helix-turn-helix domain-containing protein [Brevibacillus sp. WF146]|uniref:XRE family transcriptional regulator n=1 Tax=Brevibacillus sp. WF146 TaxID=319501 RepID=UPI0007ED5CDA|nr:XRE family transcriptional regulator [Brevibacillus sp. WF146]UYZ14212.1 helix-turn-helix domain-containing protein [Brevibacillus sp. WF146]
MERDRLRRKTLGDLLSLYRKQSGVSFSEVEAQTGVTKGALYKIESGETKRPEYKTVKALAAVLPQPYEEIIECYVDDEQRSETLYEILQDVIQRGDNIPLLEKVAVKFLQSPQVDTYTALQRLYHLADTTTNTELSLPLFNTIVKYAREHGIPQYIAKGLLKKYLIERYDFKRLDDSFRVGEEIMHYIDFLTRDEQTIYYFRMALHAHNIQQYERCIEYCEAGLKLKTAETELTARAYLAMINSFYWLGEYDAVESHLRVFERFDYEFVAYTAKFTCAIVKARKKEYDVAVPMLKECLREVSPDSRIHVVNELLDIYLQTNNHHEIAELLRKEKEILPENPQTPYKHRSIGRYYRYKGEFQIQTGSHEEGIDSYLNGLCAYGEVSAYQEITECMTNILSQFTKLRKPIDIQFVEKFGEVYSKIINK